MNAKKIADAPAQPTVEELAEAAFPETEWAQKATVLAFRAAFILGHTAAQAENTDLKTRLRSILVRLDSFSWHKNDQSWIDDLHDIAIGK